MKVLIVCYYYPPINNGGVARPLSFVKYLRKHGHDVTVLTCSQEKNIYEKGLIRIYDLNKSGIHVFPWLLYKIFTKLCGIFGWYLSYYSFWKYNVLVNLGKILQYSKPDIVIATYPPIETLFILKSIHKKDKTRIIADFRDPLIEEAAENQLFRKHKKVRKKYIELESYLENNASIMLCIAPSMCEYYLNGYASMKTKLLPNGFDKDDFKYFNEYDDVIEKFIEKEKINILYAGTLAFLDPDRDIRIFIDALRDFVNNNRGFENKIKFNLIGDFKKKELSFCQDLINNGIVEVLGKVDRKTSLKLQAACDLLILITGTERKCVTTGKIFEYINSGTPILGLTKNTFAEEIIIKSKTGLIANPKMKNEIKEALEYLFIKKKFNICNRDILYISTFDRENQVKQLINFIDNINDSL